MKKNKSDRRFELEMRKAIKEKQALKHTRVMEIGFMDNNLNHVATGTLTIDQHGKYWIDRNRRVYSFEVVEWYANALFDPTLATEITYDDLPRCRAVFLETVRFVRNTLKGGGK
jgi:hypothetical protein